MKVNGKDIMKLNRGGTWTVTIPKSAYEKLKDVELMEFGMYESGIFFKPVPMGKVKESEIL